MKAGMIKGLERNGGGTKACLGWSRMALLDRHWLQQAVSSVYQKETSSSWLNFCGYFTRRCKRLS